ncbi:MAG: AmmeMemoRadiSam system protein B [Patescibacteria group bacterium]
MLVFAGFTPSSPLLLPSINEAKQSEVQDTAAAFEELAEELYASHPDTLIVLAEAKTMYPDAFSINVADPFVASLAEYGDLGYAEKYHPDFAFIDRLQRFARKNDLPVSLSTDHELGPATAVPLDILTDHLPHVKIVPIAPSDLDAKAHYNMGVTIKHLILESQKRVAIIASGDMAHTLSKTAPAGYHKDGKAFDEAILAMLKEHNASGILQLPEKLVKNAQDTSYRQLCMLIGVLDGMYTTPTILSYEAPFGVGYCVANFVL